MAAVSNLQFYSMIVFSLSIWMIQMAAASSEKCSCSNLDIFLDDIKTNLVDDIKDVIMETANQAIKESTNEAIEVILNVVKNIKPGTVPSPSEPDNGVPPTQPPTAPPIDPTKGTSEDNPIESCTELKQVNPNYDSSEYWIKPPGASEAVKYYCDRSLTCGGITGGWMKMADWDFKDPNQACPRGFTLISSPKRLCDYTGASSVSARMGTHKVNYTHICGKVIGYQNKLPLAFLNGKKGIDSAYVYGASLTHGHSPRTHIWSFAGAPEDTLGYEQWKCPCINSNFKTSSNIPEFVGNDYFCDTASSINFMNSPRTLISNNPLWDGKGCSSINTCCTFPGGNSRPPWFYKKLPSYTTDDIDLRLMRGSYDGSTPLETVELYIQ